MQCANLSSLLHEERRAAFRARLRHWHVRRREIAIRIPRATQEKSVPADPFQQFALPALLARLTGRYPGFVRNHFVIGTRQIDDEFLPEFLHRFPPGKLAFLDLVELFLEARSESDVEHIVKTLYQQHAHALAQHRRREAPLI